MQFIEKIMTSNISEKEKISLLEEKFDELERIILAYKLRDKELIEKIKKDVTPIIFNKG